MNGTGFEGEPRPQGKGPVDFRQDRRALGIGVSGGAGSGSESRKPLAMPSTLGETAHVSEDHAALLLRPGPKRSRHFDLFDAMRAIAVFAVLVIHVGAGSGANMYSWYGVATSQGRLGVRIFFLISAFLL